MGPTVTYRRLLSCGTAGSPRCPGALLSGLAGYAEPGADLGPGVAIGAQALDSPGYGGVDLISQAGHEDKCFRVAVPDGGGRRRAGCGG